jgi:hypothetical protein
VGALSEPGSSLGALRRSWLYSLYNWVAPPLNLLFLIKILLTYQKKKKTGSPLISLGTSSFWFEMEKLDVCFYLHGLLFYLN